MADYVPEHSATGRGEVERDARQRAWRTFWQGFLVDVGAAVVAVLVTALVDIQWTEEFWLAVGSLAAKTLIMSAVSYLARRVVPPS